MNVGALNPTQSAGNIFWGPLIFPLGSPNLTADEK